MRSSILAGGAAVAWCGPALAPLIPALADGLGFQRTVDEPGCVALTFDDGPHPQGTPAVLEALALRNARATFFLVGEQVERNPGLAREIVVAGHGVGLHNHRHRNQLRLTPRELTHDIRRGADVVRSATGVAAVLYRPPYGISSAAGVRVARGLGLRTVLWSRWGRDWAAGASAESIASKATDGLIGGEVLLLHDSDAYSSEGSWRRTAAALPIVLDEISRRGLRPVAVS